jgi:hypothetical protein
MISDLIPAGRPPVSGQPGRGLQRFEFRAVFPSSAVKRNPRQAREYFVLVAVVFHRFKDEILGILKRQPQRAPQAK